MNKQNKEKFYVTTAIDYASGSPHIGHAYEKIAADSLARWNREIGKNVFFQTGTDEHGQKIVENAQIAKKSTEEFVNEKSNEFILMCEKLNISNDYFIRTTDKKHKKLIQEILQVCFDNEDIYKGTYEGLYCVGCEKYYTVDELVEGKCEIHKKAAILMKEDSYFFRLSKYEKDLLKFYDENPEFISPQSKAKETINRVQGGLRDVCISRNKESMSWGIELPFDNSHVTYVWFDALFNYYTGLKINNKTKFWPCDVHIVGHDIAWFHTVYWPAFLMSVHLELPKKVFSHGMILDGNGHKMSKSLGNVIDPVEFIKKYGVDEFRYFVLASGSFGDDINFSIDKFAEKINNELNNDLGNLISRIHAMTTKYFSGKIPKLCELIPIDIELIETLNFFEKFNLDMQNLGFNFALDKLFFAIRETNAYINKTAPYKEENKERLGTILNILCSSCILFAKYLNCFMPEKSEKIFKQFNIKNDGIFKLIFFEEGHILELKENLFSKIEIDKENGEGGKGNRDKKTPLPTHHSPIPKKQGFSSLNLKIGKIIEAKHHPNSDKLFIEKIDVGEKEPRQIVSGLVGFYTAEELVGKTVIIAANLKPAKLRGEISQGMVLAAENEEGSKVGLLISDEKIGENLRMENGEGGVEIANNESQITIDDFLKIQMISKVDKIYFNGNEITANKSSIKTDKKISGKIK